MGVSYTRYSTEDQGSTPEQVAINEELAAEEGVRIVRHFSDEGISRSLSDRPGLRDLFAYLEDHPEIGFIVVNELERMTAGVGQRQQITALCKQSRIAILTEDLGRIDPHDEDKMQQADERAVASKGEVLKVRRRVRRNLRAKVKAGSTVVLRPPYGIRMKPLVMPDGTVLPSGVSMLDAGGKKVTSGELEKHPDEYPWLVRIFEWAAEGAGLQEICRRLMDEGVPTKTGKIRWDSTTVRGILDNPLYKGEMTWGLRQTLRDENGKVYQELRDLDDRGIVTMPSPLGVIIDVATWDRVQVLKDMARTVRQGSPRTNMRQVLDHRVFCGRCGHKMYGRADKNKNGYTWRYLCLSSYGSTSYSTKPGFGNPCTTGHSISLKDLLGALAGVPSKSAQEVTVMRRVTVTRAPRADEDPRETKRRIENTITDARDRLARAEDLALDGLLSKEKLLATKAECEKIIAQADMDLLALEGEREITRPFEGKIADEFVELASGLADETIPVETRIALLDQFGLHRMYVDKPRVSFHVREGHA